MKKTFKRQQQSIVKNKVNEEIKSPIVRIVGDNVENKVCKLKEALKIAEEMDLDLVEISAKVDPPVCKILNFEKFKYEQIKAHKKRNKPVERMKTIKINSTIATHDLDVRIKHAIYFLQNRYSIKVCIYFTGRTIMFREYGEEILNKFLKGIEKFGKVISQPTFDGNKTIFVTVNPKASTVIGKK